MTGPSRSISSDFSESLGGELVKFRGGRDFGEREREKLGEEGEVERILFLFPLETRIKGSSLGGGGEICW